MAANASETKHLCRSEDSCNRAAAMGRKKNKGLKSDSAETENCNEEIANPSIDVLNGLSKKKKKKKKSKDVELSAEIDSENVACNLIKENGCEKTQVKPKKRKSGKDEEKNLEESNPASENIDSEDSSPPKKRKKKKKTEKQWNESNVSDNKSNTSPRSDEVSEKKKKKRKHLDLDDAESVETEKAETLKDKVRMDKKSKTSNGELDVEVSSEEVIPVKKKKKKKKKQKESEEMHSTCETLTEPMVGAGEERDVQVHKKKKKKKRFSDVTDDMENELEQNKHSEINLTETIDGDDSIASDKVGKERRKKKHKKVDSLVSNKPGDDSMKAGTNTVVGTCTTSTSASSAKEGKQPWKDAQSSESGQTSKLPSQNNGEEKQDASATGQWQGELFESKDRQNKFLRLLGGMKTAGGEGKKSKGLFSSHPGPGKKGLFGSLGAVVSSNRENTGNRAMTSDAAALVNQRLEEDYSRAMNLKLSGTKGAGFGFTADPAEGKKFHIDITASKSVKFD